MHTTPEKVSTSSFHDGIEIKLCYFLFVKTQHYIRELPSAFFNEVINDYRVKVSNVMKRLLPFLQKVVPVRNWNSHPYKYHFLQWFKIFAFLNTVCNLNAS